MADTVVLSLTEKPKPYLDAEQKIALVKSSFMTLKVNGIDDKVGLAAVHKARIECRDIRTGIETSREALKKDALEYGRKVDAFAKTLTDNIKEAETYLKGQEDAIENEKLRVKQLAEDQLYESRKLKVIEAGGDPIERRILIKYRDDEFTGLLISIATTVRLRKDREQEEEQRRILEKEIADANLRESQRLQQERQELARLRKEEDNRLAVQRAEIKRQQDLIDAENKRIADERAEAIRLEQLEVAKKQAAADAVIREQERIELERKSAEVIRLAEEAALKRAEELKPERQKIEALAQQLAFTDLPAVSAEVLERVRRIIGTASTQIMAIAKSLV